MAAPFCWVGDWDPAELLLATVLSLTSVTTFSSVEECLDGHSVGSIAASCPLPQASGHGQLTLL